jgi:hypothetical protein
MLLYGMLQSLFVIRIEEIRTFTLLAEEASMINFLTNLMCFYLNIILLLIQGPIYYS